METRVRTVTARTERTFAIARSAAAAFARAILDLEAGGAAGPSEAAPTRHCGQSARGVG